MKTEAVYIIKFTNGQYLEDENNSSQTTKKPLGVANKFLSEEDALDYIRTKFEPGLYTFKVKKYYYAYE